MKPDFVEPISPAPMILGVVDRDLRRVKLVVIRRIGREVADCMVWGVVGLWVSYGIGRLILSCLSITLCTVMYVESGSNVGLGIME